MIIINLWFETHNPQHPNNHTKPNITSHSFKIFTHGDHNQTLVFRGLSPITTSSFLEQIVQYVPQSQPDCLPYSSRNYE